MMQPPVDYSFYKSIIWAQARALGNELPLDGVEAALSHCQDTLKNEEALYRYFYQRPWPSRRFALLLYLAGCYQNKQDLASEELCLRHACQESPKTPECHFQLVQNYNRQKRWEAMGWWAKAGIRCDFSRSEKTPQAFTPYLIKANQLLRLEGKKIRKKVLFMIGSLHGGGAERVLVDVVKHLDPTLFLVSVQTLYDEGIYVDEVKKHAHYKSCYCQGAAHEGRNRLLKGLPIQKFAQLVIDERYDIEVAFLEDPSTLVIANSPNLDARRFAWVHTDLIKNNGEENIYSGIGEERETYGRFHDIMFVSRGVEAAFSQKIGDMGRHTVFYNPIDEENIRQLAASSPPPNKNGLTVVVVGRLVREKGVDRLLECHRRLIGEGFSYDLWVIGDGPLLKHYKRFVAQHQLEAHTRFFGFLDNPYPAMASADLLVSPSRVEGYSTVIAEALVQGIPVLATDCAGTWELLGSGDYGLIVENHEDALYDGMRRLLLDTGLLAQYQKKALARGLDFKLKERMAHLQKIFLGEFT
ncbi:MAG: glycosyltransferase [Turicibacter sp.]|nr:glycosyltransferase [Turicibacter sp.]